MWNMLMNLRKTGNICVMMLCVICMRLKYLLWYPWMIHCQLTIARNLCDSVSEAAGCQVYAIDAIFLLHSGLVPLFTLCMLCFIRTSQSCRFWKFCKPFICTVVHPQAIIFSAPFYESFLLSDYTVSWACWTAFLEACSWVPAFWTCFLMCRIWWTASWCVLRPASTSQ